MGLVGNDDVSLQKAIELAEELGLGYHRFLEKLGVKFTQEVQEMQLVSQLKRTAAEIILEDAKKGIVDWFESIYLQRYSPEEDLFVPTTEEELQLKNLFKEMSEECKERKDAVKALRGV